MENVTEERELTQEELAYKSDLDISQINRIELGSHPLTSQIFSFKNNTG